MEEPGAGGSLSRWSELPADCLERIFALAGARPTAVAASVCREARHNVLYKCSVTYYPDVVLACNSLSLRLSILQEAMEGSLSKQSGV
eukprot:jgi/Chlat1/1066/Chrsp110S08632